MSGPMLYEREPRRVEARLLVLEAAAEEGAFFAEVEDSLFYPGGGGQPADRGLLGGVEVVGAERRGARVRLALAGPLSPGEHDARLDWARRFDHMQQHSAQHLITAIAADRHGWATTSFHLGEALSDVELDVPELSRAQLDELEEEVAMVIRAARPIAARRVSSAELCALDVRTRGLPDEHEGDVRLVEIEGLDLNTCGGTHVASTAELEAVALLGSEPMRGGTRVYYVAGSRARRRLGRNEALLAELRTALGGRDEELAGLAHARAEALRRAERRVRALGRELSDLRADALAAQEGRVISAHFEEAGLDELRTIARRIGDARPDALLFFTGGADPEGVFMVVAGPASGAKAEELGPRVAELLEGRGGGRGGIFQGKAARVSSRGAAVALLNVAS